MYKGLYETGSTKSFFLKDMPADAYLNHLRRLDFWTDLERNTSTPRSAKRINPNTNIEARNTTSL